MLVQSRVAKEGGMFLEWLFDVVQLIAPLKYL